jgi:succinate-acetate transporter protein
MSNIATNNGADVEKGRFHHQNEYQNVAPASQFRPIANPGPLGLSAFALTTFVLSLVNVQARSVTTPNIVVGLALFYGGMVQFAAGMWEFAAGNTFGATALSSYGGFWLSWAVIQIPAFNVVASYEGNVQELKTAIAYYLFGWFIFTFLMLICTFRASVAFIFLFFTLDLAFLFLAIGEYTGNAACGKAGGYFGLFAAFAAWYCALSQMLNKNNSYFTLPLVSLQKKAI